MSMAAPAHQGPRRSGPARMTIGEVLAELRAEFSDVTISKIRFLESEGLVEPERTPSGYRKFARSDVERLRYVLAAQRDHYLPLRVIKRNLDAIDRGLEPPELPAGQPTVPRVVLAVDGLPDEATFDAHEPDLRLSRGELIAGAEIDDELLSSLEGYGLIRPIGDHYDADALVIAKAAAEMATYGLEARHLRSFKTAADREIGLVEQVVTPMSRQPGAGSRARGAEAARDLAALSVRLHTTLVRVGLRSFR